MTQNHLFMGSNPISGTITVPMWVKCFNIRKHFRYIFAGVMELADIGDLKSPGGYTVPVQVRSPAFNNYY